MRLAFEPVLGGQDLAAPCDHASAVEVHDGCYEALFQFWWEVEVELNVERIDLGVGDGFHVW